MKTICGIDCSKCQVKDQCKGCIATKGHPFGGNCILAKCCHELISKENVAIINTYKEKLIREFNNLHIKGMPLITELVPLNGMFINVEYPLLNGQKIKFLDDNDIYLGNQFPVNDGKGYFGVVASDQFLLVSKYENSGVNPEILIYQKREN